ncbi:hypothetical protein IJI64_00435 [Candidatus Saccharibacteria bacterium]|nr:hypothetical protein [Candidatus Saccharibacteria bacterium]
MSIIDRTLENAIQHEYLATGGDLQIGEQLILSALKLGDYYVVERIMKIYTDVIVDNPEINGDDVSTVLGHVLQRGLMEYGECNKTQLKWLFRQGPRFKLDTAHLSSAIMNWDYEVLEMLLIDMLPIMRKKLKGLDKDNLWIAASVRMEPVKFYELLLKAGLPEPTDEIFRRVLEHDSTNVDIQWFVDHGCSPNPGPSSRTFVWQDDAQSLLANYVCDYCGSKGKKSYHTIGEESAVEGYYPTIEKMLAAGADPNTKVEAEPSILAFHGAYNIMDVAATSENEEMMDLLARYGAKPTDSETRKNHYIEIMEKRLGL